MKISELFQLGNKVELNIVSHNSEGNTEEGGKVQKYFTSVYDCADEDSLIIYMPQEKGKLILIPNGKIFDVIAHSERGVFKCTVKVAERYKKGNAFLMKLDIQSAPAKFQRRDYYRCSCLIDFEYRILSDNSKLPPLTWMTVDDYLDDPATSDVRRATMLDISGGGLRFTTRETIEKDRIVLVSFTLQNGEKSEDLILLARCLASTKDELINRFEERVQFIQINESEREKIVKFIFDTERRARNYKKG